MEQGTHYSAARGGGEIMNQQWRDLRLSPELCAAAERRFGKDFSSLEQFLEFVLKELVSTDADVLDENEQRAVEARLRDLGYI